MGAHADFPGDLRTLTTCKLSCGFSRVKIVSGSRALKTTTTTTTTTHFIEKIEKLLHVHVHV